MRSPFFSIIIPTYNREKFIQKAIESVLYQSFNDWELIIIDDGSTDNTKLIIERYDTHNIHYFYYENQGRSIARNHGIDRSRGAFICFLDSDDYYLENHLQTLYNHIEENRFKECMYYTGASYQRGSQKNKIPFYDKSFPAIENLIKQPLMINSVCLKRNILEEERFPEDYNTWEDMHLWFRILVKFPFIQIEEYTTVVRNHSSQGYYEFLSSGTIEAFQSHIQCIKNLFNIPRVTTKLNYLDQKGLLFLEYRKFIIALLNIEQFDLAYVLLKDAFRDMRGTKYYFFCMKLFVRISIEKLF